MKFILVLLLLFLVVVASAHRPRRHGNGRREQHQHHQNSDPIPNPHGCLTTQNENKDIRLIPECRHVSVNCDEDLLLYCRGTPTANCLAQNKASLSAQCRFILGHSDRPRFDPHGACVGDAKALGCDQVQDPGHPAHRKGSVLSCLRLKFSKIISQDCKLAIVSHRLGACGKDLETHCAQSLASRGSIRDCMMKNYKSLSEECKTEYIQFREGPCKQDVKRHCGGRIPRGGELHSCIVRAGVAGKLSAPCEAAQHRHRVSRIVNNLGPCGSDALACPAGQSVVPCLSDSRASGRLSRECSAWVDEHLDEKHHPHLNTRHQPGSGSSSGPGPGLGLGPSHSGGGPVPVPMPAVNGTGMPRMPPHPAWRTPVHHRRIAWAIPVIVILAILSCLLCLRLRRARQRVEYLESQQRQLIQQGPVQMQVLQPQAQALVQAQPRVQVAPVPVATAPLVFGGSVPVGVPVGQGQLQFQQQQQVLAATAGWNGRQMPVSGRYYPAQVYSA